MEVDPVLRRLLLVRWKPVDARWMLVTVTVWSGDQARRLRLLSQARRGDRLLDVTGRYASVREAVDALEPLAPFAERQLPLPFGNG